MRTWFASRSLVLAQNFEAEASMVCANLVWRQEGGIKRNIIWTISSAFNEDLICFTGFDVGSKLWSRSVNGLRQLGLVPRSRTRREYYLDVWCLLTILSVFEEMLAVSHALIKLQFFLDFVQINIKFTQLLIFTVHKTGFRVWNAICFV